MSDMSLKLKDQWTIERSHESAMTLCVCGDVFESSGTHEKVTRDAHEWGELHAKCVRPERKVFWLSFCDADKPEGSRFLGACLVDVSADEAEDAMIDALIRFPLAQGGSEWIAAATRKAHQLGCNPGGEVASWEISLDNPNLSRFQRGVLMDRATVERIDAEGFAS